MMPPNFCAALAGCWLVVIGPACEFFRWVTWLAIVLLDQAMGHPADKGKIMCFAF